MNGRIQEPRLKWEVVDVELSHVFYCETDEDRDSFKEAIELLGHRAIVKEIKKNEN